ncbi:growth hormone secretagogue receptor type 1 [Chelonus insularis]|uniref:growth hormone secretagogue receptor type 1 n=1 Tax=Chelonus insularis TaxID=460826 RepID=UPI00158A0B6F|nr:growth hormone secretagogue receptor type 1 [Chelonus insularis]
MLTTVSAPALELNASYYTTAFESSSTLDGFSVSVIESGNATSTPYMLPEYIRTTSMAVCIVVMVLGIIGNLMVPLVVLRGKDMRNSTNIFLVNLSAADLCVLLICAPTVLVEVNSGPQVWPLGEHMCKAVPFVELTVAHASVLTILAISFERYYAICEPLRAGYICTKARAIFLCILAWIVAAVCTSPIISMTNYGMERDSNGMELPACQTQAKTIWPTVFFLITIAVFFIIPWLILIILYTIIARNLMANPAITRGPSSNLMKYRKQVVLMLGTVVTNFFICLLPFRAFTFWIIVAPITAILDLGIEAYFCLLYICRIMFYLHSAINPILYNLMSTKFREGFLRLCGLSRKERTNVTTSGRTGTTTSSNHSDFWRRQSNKSCTVQVSSIIAEKPVKKKEESFV